MKGNSLLGSDNCSKNVIEVSNYIWNLFMISGKPFSLTYCINKHGKNAMQVGFIEE